MTTSFVAARSPVRHEQTRARYPDAEGYIERAGVRVFWEPYGEGDPTVLLMPTWQIVHSRAWKAQIADLRRRARVITFDPPRAPRTRSPIPPEAPRWLQPSVVDW